LIWNWASRWWVRPSVRLSVDQNSKAQSTCDAGGKFLKRYAGHAGVYAINFHISYAALALLSDLAPQARWAVSDIMALDLAATSGGLGHAHAWLLNASKFINKLHWARLIRPGCVLNMFGIRFARQYER